MKGKGGSSDLESSHPALAPGDAPHGLPLHASPDPGLALEEEASDGLGEAGKVLLEVGQLGGVDLVLAVLGASPLLGLLGLLYSNCWFRSRSRNEGFQIVLVLA